MTQPRDDNLFGTVALVLGLAALVATLVSDNIAVAGVALAGLVFAPLGMWRAVQVDRGLPRSISALLLSLFALVVWVFSRGGTTAV